MLHTNITPDNLCYDQMDIGSVKGRAKASNWEAWGPFPARQYYGQIDKSIAKERSNVRN